MSRFGNLEFGNEFEGESHKAVNKDEVYYFAAAQKAFEQGEFDESLRLFSKVLEFNPESAAAWTGQVKALIELGEFQEAKVWADKALERFPKEAELLAAKGVALGRNGDLDGAIAFSDAAMEERGDTPYIWLARGDVLLARSEQRANYCFDKALLLAPKDWFVAWFAARIRYFYKQFALALQLVQRALEWNPGHSGAWVLAGWCQKELGLLTPARVSFQQALELTPKYRPATEALVNLSTAGLGLGAMVRGWWYRLTRR